MVEKLRGGERDASKAKLAYKLSETDKLAAIPDSVDEVTQMFRNRGAVEDLWDKPLKFTVGGTEVRLIEFDLPGLGPSIGSASGPQKVSIPLLLIAGVGLLSLEWLIRKLLRLA